jgi:hypothetical protein
VQDTAFSLTSFTKRNQEQINQAPSDSLYMTATCAMSSLLVSKDFHFEVGVGGIVKCHPACVNWDTFLFSSCL